jgi:glucokinase
VIGCDIGGTRIKMAAFSREGDVLKRWAEDTNDALTAAREPGFALTAKAMLARVTPSPALVGIAAPGLVAKDGRSIAYMPGKMHGIENLDWTTFLGRPSRVPVLNDAHAALLGEAWRGAATGCGNVVMLTLGTGVGGAILCDGRLLTGAIGRAGHLGHVSIADDEMRDATGVPGSLEMAIGDYTVGQRSGGRFTSTEELVRAHLAGDAEAGKIWLKSVLTLARAVASFINVLDPERVIIGGGIARAGDALFGPLAIALDEMEWRPAGHRAQIVPAQLGEWAGAYGAAWNALNL